MTDKKLTASETAAILGVSTATIYNWIRHKILVPVSKNRKLFNKSDVDNILIKIKSGEIPRLNFRANKKESTNTFIPGEYVNSEIKLDFLIDIKSLINQTEVPLETALYIIAFQLLKRKNVSIPDYIEEGMLNIASETSEAFSKIDLPFDQSDLMGLIYQSLLTEGDKSSFGSYYTPKELIDKITETIDFSGKTVFDPCCGTGNILLELLKHSPAKIHGNELNLIAARIAHINLLLAGVNEDKIKIDNKNYFHENLFEEQEKYDYIISNPPYGSNISEIELKSLRLRYPAIKSGESFSYFLLKSLDNLKPEGSLIFILPSSFLNVKQHKDIRKYLLSNCKIKKVVFFSRAFKKVFSEIISLEIINNNNTSGDTEVITAEDCYSVNIEKNRDKDFRFNIFIKSKDSQIIDKIYSVDHLTLKNNAEWALGIVTGDNKKYLSEEKKNGYEEIITGKNIHPYVIDKPGKFIFFDPKGFQQFADEKLFRKDIKFVYKFISNRLVFAPDYEKRLTLNSANILIPNFSHLSIYSSLFLLNSNVFNYLYRKKFNSIKILRHHLEELPFPIIENDINFKISSICENILENKIENEEIERILKQLFNLTSVEYSYIQDNCHNHFK